VKPDIQKTLEDFGSWIHGTEATQKTAFVSTEKLRVAATTPATKPEPEISEDEIKLLEKNMLRMEEMKAAQDKGIEKAQQNFEEKKLVMQQKNTEFLSQFATELQKQAEAQTADLEAKQKREKEKTTLRQNKELEVLRQEWKQKLDEEKENYSAERKDAEKEVRAVQSNKDILEKEFFNLQQKLTEIVAKIEKQKQSLEEVKKNVNKSREREIAAFEAEILSLQAEQAARLKAAKEQFIKKQSNLVNDHQQAMSQLRQRRECDQKTQLSILKSDEENLSKECESVSKGLEQLKAQIAHRRKQRRDLEEEFEAELKEIASKREEMQQKQQKEIEAMHQSHQQANDEIVTKQETEMKQMESSHNSMMREMKEKHESGTEKCKEKFSKEKEDMNIKHKNLLQREREELRKLRETECENLVEGDNEKLMEIKVELEAKLIDAENQIKVDRKHYRKEIGSLQEQVNSACEEIERLKKIMLKKLMISKR